jgi:hypothetical protein
VGTAVRNVAGVGRITTLVAEHLPRVLNPVLLEAVLNQAVEVLLRTTMYHSDV